MRANSANFAVEFAKELRKYRYLNGTIRNYTNAMDRFRRWLLANGKKLSTHTVEDVLDFVATLPLSRSSREGFQNAYRAWWRMVKRPGPPFADAIRLPQRSTKPFNGLERDQVYALLREAEKTGPRELACCSLLYYALCRNEEARLMRRDAMRDGWIYIMGKGLKPRSVPVHERLREALEKLEATRTDQSEWMFPGRFGKPISGNTVNVWVRLAAAAAGLGHVTPHQLRKSAGANSLDESKDLRATGELLGHSKNSLSVTAEVYTRTRDALLKEIVDTF